MLTEFNKTIRCVCISLLYKIQLSNIVFYDTPQNQKSQYFFKKIKFFDIFILLIKIRPIAIQFREAAEIAILEHTENEGVLKALIVETAYYNSRIRIFLLKKEHRQIAIHPGIFDQLPQSLRVMHIKPSEHIFPSVSVGTSENRLAVILFTIILSLFFLHYTILFVF